MGMELVSVIVPIYNAEKYVIDCVKSICNQTYKNLEIILVDDGSKDESPFLCDKLSEQDKRIMVIHQENAGVAAARNAGIDIAQGDYYMFIDSDDFLFPQIIEEMVRVSQQEDADMVVCNHVTGNVDVDLGYMNTINRLDNSIIIYSDNKMKVYLEGKDINVAPWGKIYRAHLFNEVRFPVGRTHEDNFTTYKNVHMSNKVVKMRKIGYVYRVNNLKSLTHQPFKMRHMDDLDGKLEQREFIVHNYPELISYANAGVVYACNQVLKLMIDDNVYNEELFGIFQKNYRKYILDYLFSRASLRGKIFALLATFKVEFLFKILAKA